MEMTKERKEKVLTVLKSDGGKTLEIANELNQVTNYAFGWADWYYFSDIAATRDLNGCEEVMDFAFEVSRAGITSEDDIVRYDGYDNLERVTMDELEREACEFASDLLLSLFDAWDYSEFPAAAEAWDELVELFEAWEEEDEQDESDDDEEESSEGEEEK